MHDVSSSRGLWNRLWRQKNYSWLGLGATTWSLGAAAVLMHVASAGSLLAGPLACVGLVWYNSLRSGRGHGRRLGERRGSICTYSSGHQCLLYHERPWS